MSLYILLESNETTWPIHRLQIKRVVDGAQVDTNLSIIVLQAAP